MAPWEGVDEDMITMTNVALTGPQPSGHLRACGEPCRSCRHGGDATPSVGWWRGWTMVLFMTACVLLLPRTAPAEVAAEPSYWQVVLAYSNDRLTVVEAAAMPAMVKAPQSPMPAGSPVHLPYRLRWLAGNGDVLAESETELCLGLDVPPEEAGDGDWPVPASGVVVLRVPGPSAAARAHTLELTRSASAAKQNALDVPAVFWLSQVRMPLPTVVAAPVALSSLVAGPVGVTKIRDTGSDGNRLVLVIMGDGYTSTNLANGTFSNHVATYLSKMAAKPPWNTLWPGVNVYRVDIQSNQEGADVPPEGFYADTYLDSSYYWDGSTERLLYASSSKAISVANSMVGTGVWDRILVFVNATRYGGGGGNMAVASVHSSSAEIMFHEFGHSQGGLADEYDYAGATYSGGNPSQPNVDTSPTSPKWSVWIEAGTPLPTTCVCTNTVGTFEGAYYCQYGIYRPWYSCEMRVLGQPFCPPCIEGHLRNYFRSVSLVDAVTPAAAPAVNFSNSTSLAIAPLPLPGMQYAWRAAGSVIPGATNATLMLTAAQMSQPTCVVSAIITYSSSLIRQQTVAQTCNWSVVKTTSQGTPLWWLTAHGLAPSDSGAEFDEGDGMVAWKEYLAGTDPTNRASCLGIVSVSNAAPSGSAGFVVRWSSVTGKYYRLDRGTNLLANPPFGFTVRTNIPGTPPLNSQSDTNATGAGPQFYRIGIN